MEEAPFRTHFIPRDNICRDMANKVWLWRSLENMLRKWICILLSVLTNLLVCFITHFIGFKVTTTLIGLNLILFGILILHLSFLLSRIDKFIRFLLFLLLISLRKFCTIMVNTGFFKITTFCSKLWFYTTLI